jgi:hypothetical protein
MDGSRSAVEESALQCAIVEAVPASPGPITRLTLAETLFLEIDASFGPRHTPLILTIRFAGKTRTPARSTTSSCASDKPGHTDNQEVWISISNRTLRPLFELHQTHVCNSVQLSFRCRLRIEIDVSIAILRPLAESKRSAKRPRGITQRAPRKIGKRVISSAMRRHILGKISLKHGPGHSPRWCHTVV